MIAAGIELTYFCMFLLLSFPYPFLSFRLSTHSQGEANESSNQDAMSTSSDFLDLLLQEVDSRSGTGSAASGSGSSGTGSNGCSTSGSGTREFEGGRRYACSKSTH